MLFRSITEMMVLIDFNGRIVEKNPAFLNKVLGNAGTSPETIFELHEPDKNNEIREAIGQARVSEISTLRLQLHLADGESVDTELELAAGSWHEQPVLIGLYRDIRHQIQAERLEKERRELADALSISAAVLNSSLNLEDVMGRYSTNGGFGIAHHKYQYHRVGRE
jgi:PAS domain S-box-containing protein